MASCSMRAATSPAPCSSSLAKLAAQIVDEVELAEVLAHKTDGQLFFFNIGQQRAQGGGVDVLAVDDLAIRHKAVLAVHRDIAVPVHLFQSGQIRQVHRRAARGNKIFTPLVCEGGPAPPRWIRQVRGPKRQQRAVNIKKCGLIWSCVYSCFRLRPIRAISALRASSLPSRMASTPARWAFRPYTFWPGGRRRAGR